MKLKKPPAFMFYASDFYMDTSTWDADDIGVYIRLLCMEWVNGPLEADTRKLAKIAKKTHQKFIKNWSKINQKFVVSGNGFVVNLRLEEERAKQMSFREKQREFGRLGGKPKQSLKENMEVFQQG
ncbi:MAG: YdaU family protein [Deltaproteobacteria bacterium]|nr:YdaU family protein [Deltaproteobacteria bacterium]